MRHHVARRSLFVAIAVLWLAGGAAAQSPNTINTIVGGGTQPTSPTAAFLPGLSAVVKDTAGNVYISSAPLAVVYKVSTQGQLSTYAGTGVGGFAGDGGPATSARLNTPVGLALDSGQNLYIADAGNNRVRRVDAASGVITTYAGSGNQYNGNGFFGGYSGDGGPAISAMMNFPSALAFDGDGNLFVGDASNDVVRKIDNSASHIITTYAGNGQAGTPGTANGDGGPATSAELLSFSGQVFGLATDTAGDLFIADSGDSVVRKVDTSASHIITTYAGSPSHIFTFSGNGGAANQAGLNTPWAVYVDGSGNLIIADTFNGQVRKVDATPSHIITTAVGAPGSCLSLSTGCGDGGSPTSAVLNRPAALFIDGAGNLFIYDFGTITVRMVTAGASPVISTFAGGGTGGLGGQGTSAILSGPFSIAGDISGNLFVEDNFSVNRYDSVSKNLGAYAGNGVEGVTIGPGNGDGGPATQANFFSSSALALDSSGNLFVDDFNLWIRRIDATTKTITTYAGTGATCNPTVTPACGDGGPATSATFAGIASLATDSEGNLYLGDVRLHRIRRIDVSTGIITNYAGTGVSGYSGDGGPATSATLTGPWGLVFDSQNNLYVADTGNSVIRKIDNTPAHNITTYAFNGLPTFGGDGGNALAASMQFPQQVALDANGNLFVGGGFDNVVRRIDAADQTVITVAGDIFDLDGGFSGDGGPSTQALLQNFGIAVDASKNLYIADPGNSRIRAVHLTPVASATSQLPESFGSLLPGQSSIPGTVTVTNTGLDDLILSNVHFPADFTFTTTCTGVAPAGSFSVSPGSTCFMFMTFAPPANASAGTINGDLTFSSSDTANPSFSFGLSGTVGALPGVNLSVSVTGTGTGFVFDSSFLIDCPTVSCSANYALDQQVTLTAFATTGSFTGWTVNDSTSVCPGTGPCTVTMDIAQDVEANFSSAPPSGSVTVNALGNGNGTVTSTPAGINCTITSGTATGTCTATFSVPSVTLTPQPTGNSTFAGWLTSSCGTTCTVPLGSTATAVFSGPLKSFAQGQIFVGAPSGMILVYNPNGTVAQVLNSGNLLGPIFGMNFDAAGNLYAASPFSLDFANGTVEFFANDGAGPTTFGTGNSGRPTDVLLDTAGDVFVSGCNSLASSPTLLEFAGAANGAPTSVFLPGYESTPCTPSNGNYIWLLNDNQTMLYGLTGSTIENFDVLFNHQNPDFATSLPGTAAYQIRQLSDGSVIVADKSEIVRLSSTGSVIQTYTPGGSGKFFALALNPDGLSFWTVDTFSGNVYQVRVSDGAILNTISTGVTNADAGSIFSLGGIAVLGQPQSGGTDVSVAMTVSASSILAGTPLTYTITVKNNGDVSATNVAMTDAFPFGFPFSSETVTSTLGSCTGTQAVTCVLGTMASGQSATITIVVTPTLAANLPNTAVITSTTPDPSATNNFSSTSTTVIASSTLTIIGFGTGTGNVTDNLGQINCTSTAGILTGTCSAAYGSGTVVTLTANAAASSVFGGWSTCDTTGPCSVTMSGDQTEFATFNPATQTFTLSVTGSGLGTGTVSDNFGQISCTSTAGVLSGTCSASYASGDVVVLTANPATGSGFGGWSPCPGTVNGTCSITMTANQSATAVFNISGQNFTLSITDLGSGTGAVTDNSGQINCSETSGTITGTCSGTYAPGTPVTLTANVTSPSTFAGWGGVCSSFGTGTTCSVVMNSSQNATANFIPPPVSVNLTFNPGTTVAQHATFDCPSGTNPCTDPNAHDLQLQLPQVNTAFNLTVTATEVPPSQADGLCEVGNTVLNDFDCRFTTFFNYGTDPNGNTIVPLCYPYANGNCVHYEVFSGTPGTEPDPSFYTGPVDWEIAFNNETFVPPGPFWTGSGPRFYEDPDSAVTPTSAVGSLCTQPMTINGVPQDFSCQFEFDITTAVLPGQVVDTLVQGRTKQLSDFVIAFPPNLAGQINATSAPDLATTNAEQPIGFTITVSNAGPGAENSVTLNDPLPSGPEVSWSISPAYSGPGTCSITGAVGSQVLNCSFGDLSAGASASLHVSSASAGAGTYINAASILVSSQQYLTIASVTVQALPAAFSNLTASQTISFGAPSIQLSGTVSAPGPLYPASGENVSVTINGATQSATIGTSGAFSLSFPTSTIPASSTPYTITYNYTGDNDFTAASNTSTTLTVKAATFSLSVTETGSGSGKVTDNTGQINCTETSGVVSGTCSATYSSGAAVTLTESVTSPSTFGGWGGACAANGTATTCSLTIASSLSASASFVSSSGNPTNTALTLTTSGSGASETGRLIAHVTSTAGKPSGTVAFFDNATELGTASLNSSGQATLTLSHLLGGNNRFTASYLGNSSFAASTSAPPIPLTVTVIPPKIQSHLNSIVVESAGKTQEYQANVTLTNSGNIPSTLQITSATLNGAASTSIPVPFRLKPSDSGNVSLAFPVTAGKSGSSVVLSISGTFSGQAQGGATYNGTWTVSIKVTLPATSQP